MTSRWRSRSAVAAILAGSQLLTAPLAGAAGPPTFEQFRSKVEKLAPPFPTYPGKTACVCQTGSAATTHFGYLNSMVHTDFGDQTMNVVCAVPVFTPGVGFIQCPTFEVIK